MSDGWIGVDFDGTLAEYDHWRGPKHCGRPIAPMLDRVNGWLMAGIEVRIVTARVSHNGEAQSILDADEARMAIQRWTNLHIGHVLPVVCCKDYRMLEIYDDRAIQVEKNTGRLVGHSTRPLPTDSAVEADGGTA